MKKYFSLLIALIFICLSTAVYADNSSGIQSLIANAEEIISDEKSDIYSDVSIAEDLSKFNVANDIKFFSNARNTSFSFLNCENNLSITDNSLTGDVSIYFNSDFTITESAMYMGIYDTNKLVYVSKNNISSAVGNSYINFENVNANVLSDDYTIRFFIWDNNNTPISEPFKCNVSNSIALYADKVNVELDAPVYLYNGEIMADINAFMYLGAIVEYDSTNSVIWISKNNQKIGMYLFDNVMYVFKGSNRYTVNTKYFTYVESNTIYVPVASICNEFGFIAKYNEAQNRINLFSNEVLTAQRKYKMSQSTSGYFYQMPTLNFYCADINNGLVYFSVPNSNYIYVTNGTDTIKYNINVEPRYMLSEGDYIYYSCYENYDYKIKRLDKNNNSIKTLITCPKYIESEAFYYYDGDIYLCDASTVYSASTGKVTATYNSDNHGDGAYKYETIVLNSNTVCNIKASSNSTSTKLTISTQDKYGTISTRSYTLYGTYQYINRTILSVYNDKGLYIKVGSLGSSGTDTVKVNIDSQNRITSISEATASEWNSASQTEPYSQNKFATTRLTNDYRFVVKNNMITAVDRSSGESISLINLKYACNQLLFANDDYIIYCVQNVQQVVQDGNYYYQYTGNTGLYMVDIYEGTTITLH